MSSPLPELDHRSAGGIAVRMSRTLRRFRRVARRRRESSARVAFA